MATYIIREGQSLFDVALQLYGDVTKVVELCANNPTKIPSVITRDLVGVSIEYTPQDNDVANAYRTNSTIIATRYPEVNILADFDSDFDPTMFASNLSL